jgi:protein SCO1/2
MKNKTGIFLLIFFMLLGLGFLRYYYSVMKEHPRRLPTIGEPGQHVKPFSFINQDGKIVTNKDLDGKIYVAEFFFSTCEGICPIMNENMTKVYQTYRGQADFAILSHTVKPEEDTVAQLKRHAAKYDADANQWMFLTGEKDSLYRMAIYSYLIPVEEKIDSNGIPAFIHSENFILVDKEKKLRGVYDGTDKSAVDKLIKDIVELRKEY